MFSLVSVRLAARILTVVFSLVIAFHLLVICGIVPDTIVWGGRVNSRQELLVYEAVSIALNLLMLVVAAIAAGILPLKVSARFLRVCFWVMALLFLLNTVGNLVSASSMERAIFTPFTAVLSLLCFRLAVVRVSE